MYHQFYHLKQDPFADTPDPEFLFLSPSHKAALRALTEGIDTRQGWMALFGAAGLGKTTLLRAYLEKISHVSFQAIYIFYSKISFVELLDLLAQELQFTYSTDDPTARLEQLHQVLLAAHAGGRHTVVIIDEAQHMPVETLERLAAFANLVTPSRTPLIQLVFAGLPEFRRTLQLRALRSLKQRLAVCVTLAPFTPRESLAYVRHRLTKVYVPDEAIFTAGALRHIVRYAKGNPRMLNTLCANMLITGVVRQERRVSAGIAQEVIAEFGTRRFARLLRWGVAYAAGIVLMTGLAWGIGSGRLDFTAKAPLTLSHLWPLSEVFRKYKEEQLAAAIATSTQRQVSIPAPYMVAELREPLPLALPVPTAADFVTPPWLFPTVTPGSPLKVQRAARLVEYAAPGPVAAVSPPSVEPTREAAVPPPVAPLAPPLGRKKRGVAVAPTSVAAKPAFPEYAAADHADKAQVASRPSASADADGQMTQVPAASAMPHLAGIGKSILEIPPRFAVDSGGHEAVIREVLFTADGRELISVSDDKTIRVWSVTSDGRRGALARTIRGAVGPGREGALAAATLSPVDTAGKQRWLAVGGVLPGAAPERYAIRLHDYASGEVAGLLRGHSDAIVALAFAPDGRWLASAGKDATIRVWDMHALQGTRMTQEPLLLKAHTDHIYDLAWSKSGDRLASASYDRTVGLWDTSQLARHGAALVARLQGHEDQVQSVTFHPESAVLVSAGKDQTLRQWRGIDGASLGVLARATHKMAALTFSPDGSMLLAGNYSPPRPDRLTLFAYPSGKVQQVFTGHQNLVLATAFHPSGQWIASGGGEQKEILLWEAQSGAVLSRLEGKGRTIYDVGFSRDGRYLSWGHAINYATPNHPGPLEQRFDLTQLARLSGGLPDAAVVRARGQVGDMKLVSEQGGPYGHNSRLHIQQNTRRIGTIERSHTDGYRHSAYTFTPDGQYVLSGGMNGVLRLYTLDGSLRASMVGHVGEIKAVAISADGRWAVSGANDQTLKLWSLAGLPSSGTLDVAPTLSLFPAADGEWVAWTPEGFYAASPHGDGLLGHPMDQGLDKLVAYIPATQFRERFYRPETVHAKLHDDMTTQSVRTAQRDGTR